MEAGIGERVARAGNSRLNSLEIGRFVAACINVLCHEVPYMQAHAAGAANGFLGALVFPGHFCVQYFFALSGFVLVCVHHGDFGKISAIPRFWWLRMWRIYPAYWLALIIPVFFLFGTLTPGHAASVLLLDPWHDKEFIPAVWTLRYEIAFYIMFGLFMLPYVGKPLLAYWCILVFWRWNNLPLFQVHTPLLLGPNLFAITYGYKFVDIYNLNFFGGMAAGYLFVKHRFGARFYVGCGLAGAVLVAWLLPQEGWGEHYGGNSIFLLAMSGGLGAVMLGLAGLERRGALRIGRWGAWLGMMSYPLYIFHQPLMLLTDNLLHWGIYSGWAVYGRLILLLAATLVIAAAVTFGFDQPVQRRLRRLTRRIWPQTSRAVPAAVLAPGR